MSRWADQWRAAVITGLGTGYVPRGGGSVGTLVAVAYFVAVMLLLGTPWREAALAAGLLASSAGTVALGPWVERYFGKKDPGQCVLDEIAGFLLTVLVFHPAGASLTATTVWAYGLARVFDITKPFPVRRLERLPKGWGVLLDDLLASVYAAGGLWVVYWLRPGWFVFGW